MFARSAELADEIGFVRYRFLPRIKLGELREASGAVGEAGRLYREALGVASENDDEAAVEQALVRLRGLR